PLILVAPRHLDRVAGVAQVQEVDALDDSAALHVQTGDDPLGKHRDTMGMYVLIHFTRCETGGQRAGEFLRWWCRSEKTSKTYCVCASPRKAVVSRSRASAITGQSSRLFRSSTMRMSLPLR